MNLITNNVVLQLKNLQSAESKFQAAQTANAVQGETLKHDLDKVQAARDVYAEQLQTTEETLSCANKNLFKQNYLSDEAMLKALTDYLIYTEGGEIKEASWEPLWAGSISAMITIILSQNTAESSHIFIVYHNYAHFKTNRVFPSVVNAGWMDRKFSEPGMTETLNSPSHTCL